MSGTTPAWPVRAKAAVAAVALIARGLAGGRDAAELPDFVASYAGDTLWALLVYASCTLALPRASIAARAASALAFAFAIEASQLYRAPWIDDIRASRLVALVLGSGFLWSDLACYTAGVACGALVERLVAAAASLRPRPGSRA